VLGEEMLTAEEIVHNEMEREHKALIEYEKAKAIRDKVAKERNDEYRKKQRGGEYEVCTWD